MPVNSGFGAGGGESQEHVVSNLAAISSRTIRGWQSPSRIGVECERAQGPDALPEAAPATFVHAGRMCSPCAAVWRVAVRKRSPTPREAAPDREAIGLQVAAFCGDCHAVPPPGSFPRRAWREQVELGHRFYVESGRNDLLVPPMNDVIGYYESLAPEELVLPAPEAAADGVTIRFERTVIEFPHSRPLFPAVSHLRRTAVGGRWPAGVAVLRHERRRSAPADP